MARLNQQNIHVGEAVQVAGPTDREAYIRQTLERLRIEKLKQVDAEVQDILSKAREKAGQIILDAETQAETIITDGQSKVEQAYAEGVAQGHEQGYAEGYREGREQAEDDTEALLLASNILIERAYQTQQQILNHYSPRIRAIIDAVVSQVLNTQLDAFSDSDWETLLTHILSNLNLSSQYRLVVSADAYKEFKELSPRIAKAFDDIDRLIIDVDPQLALHEMYAIGDEGTIDISPSTQARELTDVIEPHLDIPEIAPEQINPDDETEQLNELREGFLHQYQRRHMPPEQMMEAEDTPLAPDPNNAGMPPSDPTDPLTE